MSRTKRGGRRDAAGEIISTALAGLVGLVLTVVYDVLTNIGSFVLVTDERSISNLWKFVVGGVAFSGMHIVWNTAVFLVVLRPVLIVLGHYRHELA